MRFLGMTWAAAGRLRVLSILFMRFTGSRTACKRRPATIFQFSLWDSVNMPKKRVNGDLFFQFSLWDSEALKAYFELLDLLLSILFMRFPPPVELFNVVLVSFNSLYEIHRFQSFRKYRSTFLSILFMRFKKNVRKAMKSFLNIYFQFSLWDSHLYFPPCWWWGFLSILFMRFYNREND